MHEVAHLLLGAVPEGLFLFGRVYASETDLVLRVGLVQNRDGVAIGDANDIPGSVSAQPPTTEKRSVHRATQ